MSTPAPAPAPTTIHPRVPFVIGVTGGTASGKTTVCEEIIKRLEGLTSRVAMISMDRFYRSLTADEVDAPSSHNFDHPEAFDFHQFANSLRSLISADQPVPLPQYCFKTHQRLPTTDLYQPCDVIIVEGILTLYSPEIRALMDLKIFVDTDDDVRLARRINRDIRERGRTVEDVLYQYLKTVKPSHDDFIAPTKRYADIIVPRGGDNNVAINLLVEHIQLKLKERSEQ